MQIKKLKKLKFEDINSLNGSSIFPLSKLNTTKKLKNKFVYINFKNNRKKETYFNYFNFNNIDLKK